MSTLRKFTLALTAFSFLVAGLGFVTVSYADLPPADSSPISNPGNITPYRVTASGAGDQFPSNTDSNTCQRLAAFNLPGWADLDLELAVGGKINSSAGATFGPVTTNTDGQYLSWTIGSGYKMLGVVMKGGNDANIYNYADTALTADGNLAAPPNSSGNPAGISHYNICYIPTGGQPNTYSISGKKFFDINGNGIMDGEGALADFVLGGFVIKTTFVPELLAEDNDVERTTDALGQWQINGIPEGTDYLVREVVPNTACDINGNVISNFTWTQTAPALITAVEPFGSFGQIRAYQGDISGNVTGLDFGNRCQRQGTGGYTLGFWSNRNGRNLFGAEDLAAMVALNLRNGNGTAFDPANYDAFRTWILGASSTNMAYMLSAQFAASKLNVLNGFIDGDALLDVNGEIGTLNGWFTEANTSLGLYDVTLSGHAERANQERLKNIFDRVNNNNFVFINTACRACPAS